MALHNSHRTHFAMHWEVSPGLVLANAAACAAAEGTTLYRFFAETAEPDYILGDAAVANADMQTRVGEAQPPHLGLPTADGGSIVMRLWGSATTYAAGDPKVQSPIGHILAHCLGGSSLGGDGEVDSVTSQTILVLAAGEGANLLVGQIIGIEDADDLGRIFPAVLTAVATDTITLDRVMPFTVAIGDKIYGAETAFYAQAPLTNPDDADYETVSLIYCKGPNTWMAGGGHLALTSIAFERGMQPKLNLEVLAARGYPPGVTGGISGTPTYTGTIQGFTDVLAIGRDTKCRLATDGATTTSEVSLFSFALSVGCPVIAQDGVTEATSGMVARLGYRTEPAATTMTIVVALADAEQTRWTAGTRLTCTYYQVAGVGACWAIHGRNGFLMAPPKPVLDGVNKYELVIQFSDADADTGTTELSFSKILIGLY
jgi:hypothetical protein